MINLLIILLLCSVSLFGQNKEVDYSHYCAKAISIDENGCGIKSILSISHYGQFKVYSIPYPKEALITKLECSNYEIDSSGSLGNVIKFYSREARVEIENNCKYDFNISSDSIYTISNVSNTKYHLFEELKDVKGYGSNYPYSHFFISFYIPKTYKFVSIKENLEDVDFKFSEEYNTENEIYLTASNVSSFVFEIKYVKKNPQLKTNIKNIDVEGDVELKIYDESREDGDIINVFVDNKIVLNHYEAKNKPYKLLVKVKKGSCVRIENVDEGKFPPNTVVVEILDKKKTHKLDVKTMKNQDFQINLNIKS